MSPLCPFHVTKCRWAFAAVQVGPRNLVAAHVAAPPPPRCQVLTGVCCRASGTEGPRLENSAAQAQVGRTGSRALRHTSFACACQLLVYNSTIPTIHHPKKTSRHDKEKVTSSGLVFSGAGDV